MPKITQKEKIAFIRKKLATNRMWAEKALVKIFEAQTPSEQDAQAVHMHNNVGFTVTDAKFLTGCAKMVIRKDHVSDAQLPYVFKLMPKYANQILRCDTMDEGLLEIQMNLG